MEKLKNYKKEKLTISLLKANLTAFILIIPTLLIYGVPFYLLWGKPEFKSVLDNEIVRGDKFLLLIILILGIVIHELLHGITWSFFTKTGLKSFEIKILWKKLTPYCYCKEPLKVKHFILGAIMPYIILGAIPAIISIIIGNSALFMISIAFTIIATGDFMIINLIRKEPESSLIQSFPSEAGFYVYREN